MDELITLSLSYPAGTGNEKTSKMSERWETLKANLCQSWEKALIPSVDRDCSEIAKFLYVNKDYLIKESLMSEEEYAAAIEFLDALISIICILDNSAKPSALKRDMARLIREVEDVRTRLNKPDIPS